MNEMCNEMIQTGSYVIVRTQSAGVFAGRLLQRQGDEVLLGDARRIWYWAGAASLSELAVRGPSRPSQCKFPTAVSSIILTGVIEIIATTQAAQDKIAEVLEWTAH